MSATEPFTTHSIENRQVLICGASFAGLSTAYWMNRLGYHVTVVEIGNALKTGGTPVNIEGETVGIVQRMGLLERIRSSSLPVRRVEFVDAHGRGLGTIPAQADGNGAGGPEYEIERDELLRMQFDDVKEDVKFIFHDSIDRMTESKDEVVVDFKSGRQGAFAFVFGCDGNHSAVRKMYFGEESAYSVFLQLYFSITIVDKLLLEENTSQIFNIPGKTIMLNGYNGKTDICFCYFSEQEIAYNYRDTAQQRQIIFEHFSNEGWRAGELLDEMNSSDNFYFDKLCQIKMPAWTKGRVALVGDAAYCASPAAGMGGSLAIVGASALAEAFQKYPHDFNAAFKEYDQRLRPVIENVQAQAIEFGLEMFAPRSEEAIRARNARLSSN
jgi:2-polyprenyl-6-methoxyphenol hydroxylase-like FAD-dependent oxidoreductase